MSRQSDRVEVDLSSVGNVRVFGVKLSDSAALARTMSGDGPAGMVVPLSHDHTPRCQTERMRIEAAGGVVDDNATSINYHPLSGCTRAFGLKCLKSNPKLPPTEQLVSAEPDLAEWSMKDGDVFVVATQSAFDTSTGEKLDLQPHADVIINRFGTNPRSCKVEDVAADLCDVALSYGSRRSMTVLVARAGAPNRPLTGPRPECRYVPGPLYSNALEYIGVFKKAVKEECIRCGTTPPKMLRARWDAVNRFLPKHNGLLHMTRELTPLFPAESGALEHMLIDEALFFAGGPSVHVERTAEQQEKETMGYFERLANRVFA